MDNDVCEIDPTENYKTHECEQIVKPLNNNNCCKPNLNIQNNIIIITAVNGK